MSFKVTKKRKRRKKSIRAKTTQDESKKQSAVERPASEGRTAWHVFFIRLLKQKGPRSFEITGEFPFGKAPQRADCLLLRRKEDRALDSSAEVLKELWGKIDKVAVLEFRSISAPFAKGDFYRLLGYGFQYIVMAENVLLRTLIATRQTTKDY